MALILHIDTALQQANIGIANNGALIINIQNEDQQSHASFVQPAIQKVLQQSGIRLESIDAIGVIAGPGSYTGLRVAMASAKGLCYALQKPLLSISTLEVMTTAAIKAFPGFNFYCPMIDARRNEVYTALYNAALKVEIAAQPLILSNAGFNEELSKGKILFFGDGSIKYKDILIPHANASFENVMYDGSHISSCLFNSFKNNAFEDVAYAEPLYLKAFYTGKV